MKTANCAGYRRKAKLDPATPTESTSQKSPTKPDDLKCPKILDSIVKSDFKNSSHI